MKKSVRLVVNVEPEVREWLEEKRKTGQTISGLVRHLLHEMYLKEGGLVK